MSIVVAALYVDARGPYPKMPGVDCWGADRDAENYAGPWPVVAHPPCGPWGRLRQFCTRQPASCGPAAVASVRRFGGVLEHPAGSLLWRHCSMPEPDWLPDEFGGRTYEVRQVAWGHRCEKLTWLYVVGVDARRTADGIRVGGRATHTISSSRRVVGDRLPEITVKWERAITPPAFATWLVELASSVDNRARSLNSHKPDVSPADTSEPHQALPGKVAI